MDNREADKRGSLPEGDNPPTIRSAEASDLDAIFLLEKSCFYDNWSRDSIASELLDNRQTECYVLEEGGRLLGYYFAWHIAGESSLNNIAVEEAERGKGYGKLLMEHFLGRAEEKGSEDLYLEVSTENRPAIALYQKYGFERVGLRKNYYPKLHEDAYIMRKTEGGRSV